MYLAESQCHICLGVAFSTMDMKKPYPITSWPGSKEVVAWKVPTRVGYRAGCMGCKSWGFECPEPEEFDTGMDVIECFKLYLDPSFLKTREHNPENVFWKDGDVKMWFRDFLTALHKHIVKDISKTFNELGEPGLGDWNPRTVEYIFSFPTSWRTTSVVETFEEIVTEAGFGNCKNHSVIIKLTEAEAAAVYAAKNPKHQHPVHPRNQSTESLPAEVSQPREGHTLLICDSGGGTTVGL